MRKWWVILVVLVVAAAAAAALALRNLDAYVDANRDAIAARVSAELGREVAFEGASVSLRGGLAVRVDGLRIADDPDYAEGAFVRAGRVQVRIALVPALFGRIEVRRVVLSEPAITVIRTADGLNYESLGRAPAADAGAAARADADAAETGGGDRAAPPVMLLGAMTSIRDGRLRYVDRTARPVSEIVVEQLDLTTEARGPRGPLEVDGRAALAGGTDRNLAVHGTIGPAADEAALDQAPLDVTLELDPLPRDALTALPGVGDALPEELVLPAALHVKVHATGSIAAPTVEGEIDLSAGRVAWGERFDKPAGVPATLQVTLRRTDGRIAVERLRARVAEAELSGSGTVRPGTLSAVDLHLTSNPVPLADLRRLVPDLAPWELSGTAALDVTVKGWVGESSRPTIELTAAVEDAGVRGADLPITIADLTTTVAYARERATLAEARPTLNGAPATVRGHADLGGQPTAHLELTVRELDRRHLGPAAALLPEGETVRDLVATVDLVERRLAVKRYTLKAFGGGIQGNLSVDVADPERPAFRTHTTLRALDLERMLVDRGAGRITGVLQGDVRLSGAGTTWAAARETLEGGVIYRVSDGMLRDVNLAESVLTRMTGIGGLSRLVSPSLRRKYGELFGEDTRFKAMAGSAGIANGRARSENFRLEAPNYEIRAEGQLVFDDELDLKGTIRTSRPLSDDLIAEVRELRYLTDPERRIEIPFSVGGTLAKPKVRPDESLVTRALARAAVERGLEELLGADEKREAPAPSDPEEPRRLEDVLLEQGLEWLRRR